MDAVLAQRKLRRDHRTWGLGPTLMFAVLAQVIALVAHVAAAVVVVSLAKARHPHFVLEDLENVYRASMGSVMALAVGLRAPLLAAIAILLARQRKGLPVRSYLGLRRVKGVRVAAWTGLAVVLVLAFNALLHLVGGPWVPPSVSRLDAPDLGLAPLLVVWMVLAPLGDELFFRGLVLQGIRHSRFCGAASSVLSSMWWAGMYWQHDVTVLAQLFVLGMVLGIARVQTRSTFTSVVMHATVGVMVSWAAWFS